MLLPSTDDVEALCRVYRADPDTTDDLIDAVAGLRNEIVSARTILRRGAHRQQRRIAQMEADATHIRSYQPALVVGLLQTPDYARELAVADLGPDEAAKVTAAKRDRADALASPGKTFTLIMPEGALWTQVAGPELMAAQVDAIAAHTHTPGVHVGVIPWTIPMHVYPEHGWDAYDDQAVIVATETGIATVTNPSDIAVYLDMFEQLTELASFGDGAHAVLSRIAAEYRSLAD